MADLLEELEAQIAGAKATTAWQNVGVIREVGDGVARVEGLTDAMLNEMLDLGHGITGLALNLEESEVGVIVLGDYTQLREGDEVRTTGKLLRVPVGKALLGRVVNTLGEPLDGKGPIESQVFYPVEKLAPGIIRRSPVRQPVQTGIMAIDALIIYDDLSKHAVAYRQVSLVLKRPSGREAYPGDVFYLHSRLLERAARVGEKYGNGSLTALPIIETQAGDVSAYIPTNVISITDGQIYLETDLFYQGVRPAISVGLSVSRVGSAAQIKAIKQVAGKVKLDLAQFRELAAFAQFGSDLDAATKARLERGQRIVELFKQKQYNPIPVEEQVAVMWAMQNGYVDPVPVDRVKEYQLKLQDWLQTRKESLLRAIREKGQLDQDLESQLKSALEDFKTTWK